MVVVVIVETARSEPIEAHEGNGIIGVGTYNVLYKYEARGGVRDLGFF